MVLKILGTLIKVLVPSNHYITVLISLVSLYILYAFVQGRVTSRDRDLNARVFLVTGGFTPLGLTVLEQLAKRGAHIIALTSSCIDSPDITSLVTLLRTTTSNKQIYAEECNLTSPKSIHALCTKFLTGGDQRLDGIIFAHEYGYITHSDVAAAARSASSLATFLITTLLLPALLIAPVERDIRILNICNPFYAAAIPTFTPGLEGFSASRNSSNFIAEGSRSLRTIIFTRHLQRVLDALPRSGQVLATDSSMPIISAKSQKSNIVCVSVCPGMGNADIVMPLLGLRVTNNPLRFILWMCLQPFLFILTKSTLSSAQSVLHALFLPTPFKSSTFSSDTVGTTAKRNPLEVLKPGALYRECAVVVLSNRLVPAHNEDDAENQGRDGKISEDDAEYGGERLGRLVWESFESGLKKWESAESAEGAKP